MVKPDPAFLHKPVIQQQPKFEAVLNFISEPNIVLSILILHPSKLCVALIKEEFEKFAEEMSTGGGLDEYL